MPHFVIFGEQPISMVGLRFCLEQHFCDLKISEIKTDNQHPFKLNPDCIILVISDLKNNAACEKIADEYGLEIPIIVLYNEFELGSQMMKRGIEIKGMVSLQAETSELLRAIEMIITGKRYFCINTIQEIIAKQFSDRIDYSLKAESLTKREQQVYDLLIKGLKTKAIGQILNIKSSTVSTIKSKVLSKMDVSNVIEIMSQPN